MGMQLNDDAQVERLSQISLAHIEREEHNNHPQQSRKPRGFSLARLKIFGAVVMVLSVMGVSVFPKLFGGLTQDNMTALTVAIVCEVLSWMAIPWYAWLLVRGMHNTRHVGFYLLRLVVLALICEIPYDITTSGTWFDMRSQNPVFGLVVALAVLAAIRYVSARNEQEPLGARRIFICVIIIMAGVLWNLIGKIGVRQQLMFGGVILLGFALIFSLLERYEIRMELFAGMFGAMSLVSPGIGVAVLHYRSRVGDGKRPTKRFRMFMYAWYPTLLILACILQNIG